MYVHQKSSAALYKNNQSSRLTHAGFLLLIGFQWDSTSPQRVAQVFWCDADRVGDLLNRCLRNTWWHQSLDSYKYVRLPHCCHWCSNMFQPSFLYRISPPSYFLLQHPHVFCDWPFFQVQNLLRTHQLRHRLTMFSLSQESYHLVPTQKAPRVKSFGGGEVSLGHFDVFPRCVCWNSWLCVCFLRDVLI